MRAHAVLIPGLAALMVMPDASAQSFKEKLKKATEEAGQQSNRKSSKIHNALFEPLGAPALHVAVQEALYHITASPAGTHRALLETPYFHFNY